MINCICFSKRLSLKLSYNMSFLLLGQKEEKTDVGIRKYKRKGDEKGKASYSVDREKNVWVKKGKNSNDFDSFKDRSLYEQ